MKFCEIILIFCISVTASSAPTLNWQNVRTVSELIKVLQRNPNFQKNFSNLNQSIKNAATYGIMLGTVKVEEQMELNILKLLSEFIRNIQKPNMKSAVNKLKDIETAMERDNVAIEVLKTSMDFATKTKTLREYRQALSKMGSDDVKSKYTNIQKPKRSKNQMTMVSELHQNIQNHLKLMRDKVGATVQQTMKSISSKKKKLEIGSTPPTITSLDTRMHNSFNSETAHFPQLHVQMPMGPVYRIDVESFYRFRRQNNGNGEESKNQVDKENDENFDDGLPSPAGNGGIGGLIASLSGGEGGSDVGALIGAISGVITNLFGPGGLDISSLLSTGTSLIAGLLGGDENFGKVLGSYIGIAVEGLSGGGGAVSRYNFNRFFQISCNLSRTRTESFLVILLGLCWHN